MPRQYNSCLQSLMDQVDGLPTEEISNDQIARLQDAGGQEDAGQNVFECQVIGCSMEMKTQVLMGKLTLMSTDVLTGQQPCQKP